jgi:TRAP transporter TAXI family solute receptor
MRARHLAALRIVLAVGVLLVACAAPAPTPTPPPPPKPTVAAPPPKPTSAEPQKPAEPPKPAAAAPAPAATTAPAATKPPEKPAAAAPAAGALAAKPGDQGPCTTANATKPRPTGKARLVIGTGGTGGVFFPYGGGLARILSAKMTNTEMTAEVTGGSVDNFKLINSGQADVGMSTVDSAYDAFNGTGAYRDVGKVPGCTIISAYQSYIHIVALADSNINSVEDMKGKRISVGSPGSSTEGAADRILEAARVDGKADIKREALSVAESVSAMKDRKIDAFFWIGGLPTAAVTDLVSTPNLKVKFIPGDKYLQPMRDKYGPIYAAFTLPGRVYTGVEPTPGIGIGNIFFVNANMSEDLVYDLVKTIFDNLDDVKKVHPEAQTLSVDTAAINSSIPFHPGAIKYYREKGVWKG